MIRWNCSGRHCKRKCSWCQVSSLWLRCLRSTVQLMILHCWSWHQRIRVLYVGNLNCEFFAWTNRCFWLQKSTALYFKIDGDGCQVGCYNTFLLVFTDISRITVASTVGWETEDLSWKPYVYCVAWGHIVRGCDREIIVSIRASYVRFSSHHYCLRSGCRIGLDYWAIVNPSLDTREHDPIIR